MKKRFTSMIVLAMLAVSMFAGNLPLIIAGVQVTDENSENLMAELQKLELTQLQGSITYYPSLRVLELTDFMINGNGKDLIGLEFTGDVVVVLNGKNHISNFKQAVLQHENADVIFCGIGSLEVVSLDKDQAPFALDNEAELMFNYTNLKVRSVTSAFVAVKGDAAEKTKLTFANSEIDVQYSHRPLEEGYGVENINSLNILYSTVALKPEVDEEGNFAIKVPELNLTLAYLSIQNASDYVFSPTKKTYDNGSIWDIRELTWAKDLDNKEYFVSIAGKLNEGDDYSWKEEMANGKARYVHHEGGRDTLYLDNARFHTMNGHGVITLYYPAVIYLTGENECSSNTVPAIYSVDNTLDFSGDGSIEARGQGAAIYSRAMHVEEGVTLKAVGDYGFYNPEESTAYWVLMVDGSADVTLVGMNKNPAMYLNNKNANGGLDLRYGNIVAFPYDTAEVFTAEEVRFAKPEWIENISIFGNDVHSLNARYLHEVLHATKADEKGDPCSLQYDRDKHQLLCSNLLVVNLNNPEGAPFLNASGMEMTMVIEGENRISLMSDQPTNVIEADGNFTLEGKYENPSLTITGTDDGANAFILLGDNADLTLHYLTVKSTARRGIRGRSHNSAAAIHFLDADIILTAKNEVYSNIADMTFDNSRILAPSGAKFDAEKLSIVDEDGNIVKDGTVWIESYIEEEGIEEVTGDRLTVKELRNGQLYIRRGEKIYNAFGVMIE